ATVTINTADTVAPETSLFSTPTNPSSSMTAIFTFGGTDAGSGVIRFECSLDGASWATCGSGVTYTNLSYGIHAFSVRAIDVAGNVDPTPASYSWSIPFPFSGFLPPVDNPPALNVVKAGSAVPVKFNLGGDPGLDVFAAGYPAAMTIPCPAGGTTQGIAETV